MLRRTIFVLATAAALSGALTADAVALATAHTGWDGLGDGGGHSSSYRPEHYRPTETSRSYRGQHRGFPPRNN
jgi:opacity protein-like surface antigen